MMNDEKPILREFEDDIDGIVYNITIYTDGHIEKQRKAGYEDAITNTEEANLEMQMNIQYLVDLTEINTEEE